MDTMRAYNLGAEFALHRTIADDAREAVGVDLQYSVICNPSVTIHKLRVDSLRRVQGKPELLNMYVLERMKVAEDPPKVSFDAFEAVVFWEGFENMNRSLKNRTKPDSIKTSDSGRRYA